MSIKQRDRSQENRIPTPASIEKRIDDFGKRADAQEKNLNPKAPRNFTSRTLPFNEFENQRILEAVDRSTHSGVNAFIRAAIEEKIRRELD